MSGQDARAGGRVLGLEVPEPERCGLGIAPRDQPAAVAADCHTGEFEWVPTQDARAGGWVLGGEVPNTQRLVQTAFYQPAAVGTDRHGAVAVIEVSQNARVGGLVLRPE